jgi:hypothetical protein
VKLSEPDMGRRNGGSVRRRTRGYKVAAWIEANCVFTQGEWVGKPFRLLPWQKRLLWSCSSWARVAGRIRGYRVPAGWFASFTFTRSTSARTVATSRDSCSAGGRPNGLERTVIGSAKRNAALRCDPS